MRLHETAEPAGRGEPNGGSSVDRHRQLVALSSMSILFLFSATAIVPGCCRGQFASLQLGLGVSATYWHKLWELVFDLSALLS